MTFLLASVVLLHLVAAIPTPTILPRSCTTITPKSLQPLDNTWPDVSSAQGLFTGTSSLMVMHNNINASNQLHSLQLVEFEIPPNASPCQLQITDPACSLSFTNSSTSSYQISSPVQLKVISLLPNSLSSKRSYNDIFNANPSVVSSWDFGDATMSAGDSKIFNSEGCPVPVGGKNGSLYYVLDYENEGVAQGWSEWTMLQQDEDVKSGKEMNGVYLIYC
ncbi:hypothetical protein EG329_012177 [Mollisiaceae sp. DMI_Dod_QoI]|nr:hypothetical protein EG329_012177 [Helotiales sp. DMI_Dod_QoI]